VFAHLATQTAQAILFSPAASKNSQVTATTGARGHRRSGPIGIAKSYDLKEVTPAFLAYVAVVVRTDFASQCKFINCSQQ
jgi:hypothetical protein